MVFKEIQIHSSGLEPKALISKLELMNKDTYGPILNRVRNDVQWFSSDIFSKKVEVEYPNLWVMFNSDNVTMDSLLFYIAYSNLVETRGISTIKLGFAAYDPQVPKQPKEIRRQIHLDAYRQLLPLLNSKYNNPLVFVQIPETSYPIKSIFRQLAFAPIADPELLNTILTAHNIKYCVQENRSAEEGIKYQVTQKHSGVNDGSLFLGYMYRNPHPKENIILTEGRWNNNIPWKFIVSEKKPHSNLCTAVFCVTTHHGKLLLSNNKKRGWEIPGGHIDEDEEIEQALVREVMEEAGAVVENPKMFGYIMVAPESPIPYRDKKESFYRFPYSYILYYYAEASDILGLELAPDVIETKLVGLDEAKNMLAKGYGHDKILEYLIQSELIKVS